MSTPANMSAPSTGSKPWNDVNKVEIIGRVGVKPEVTLTKRSTVTKTTVYLTNEYDTTDGQRVKNTTRIPVVFYGEKGTQLAHDIASGDAVKITGRLHENKWEDPTSHQMRSRLELVGFEYQLVKKKADRAA